LDWDGEPVYQSQRATAFAAALATLRAADLIYPSFASRRELAWVTQAPHPDDNHTANADKDRAPAWRFRASREPVAFTDAIHGPCSLATDDFIVSRNDGIAAYQLATVVDDHFQGVTEIVRGDDLLSSTPRQILLARALGYPSPRYVHVPLVLDAGGERMAKRRDSTRLAAMREAGIPAAQVIGLLAASCGLAKAGELVKPVQLIERFDLSKLPRQAVQLTGP
jgi:glutamyl-tRNA synthetase